MTRELKCIVNALASIPFSFMDLMTLYFAKI